MRTLFAFLLLAAPLAPAEAQAPSVVFVTMDTTRADRMGFLGSTRGLTPNLDALATQAVVFERAYSQVPITTASHATLFSGTYPQFHRVTDFGIPLPETLPYLPALLKARGYQTAAFVGSLILDPRNGLAPGFDRGFDVYDAGYRQRRGKEDRYKTMERRAEDVVARAIAWLPGAAGKPFFLWVHLFDAHDPYEAPAPFGARFAKAPYDGEIASVDAALGTLIAALKARPGFENTLVAIYADHGESLGDHGEATHGVFLYDSTIHVPLLLKLPGGRSAGARVATRAGLVDLAPTVLAALGAPVPATMQGASLLPFIGAARPTERPQYAETDYPRRAFGWSSLGAYRADRFLYVRSPIRELYDSVADPGQAKNLAEQRGAAADRIQAEMDAFRKRTAVEGIAAELAPVDAEIAEKLAALGYVGGSASPSAAVSGLDPKERIAVSNLLHDAMAAIEAGDMDRAAPLLEKVTVSDPQIPMAQLQLGIARARQRRYKDAIAPLRKAIELNPDAAMAHYEMGVALYETGDLKTAAGHFEIVTKRMPKWSDARFSYGSVLARINRVPEAESELRAALELEPKHYRANLLLGRLLDLQGKSKEGVVYLRRAVEANPESAEAKAFLADALARSGTP
jgi:arylsulfatase A-like enzyme/Tfp pilus assembly protein PilF